MRIGLSGEKSELFLKSGSQLGKKNIILKKVGCFLLTSYDYFKGQIYKTIILNRLSLA